MRIESQIPPTIPFHVARAYGVSPKAQVQRVGSTDRVSGASSAETGVAAGRELSVAGQRLVAGVVPGRVDFSGEQPRQSESLAMYRHPADRNAAATGVAIGRKLDVNG